MRSLRAILMPQISASCLPERPRGLSDVAIGGLSDWSPTSENGEAAMATVYVVTAGSGESYRIERVYLDREQAYGFAQAYNGIAPVEPVQVGEWQDGAPLAAYDR